MFGWIGAGGYQPHAICLTGDPYVIGIYVLTDATIFLSYMAIAGSLMLHFRWGVPMRPLAFPIFAAFILLCGFTHLTDVLVLFVPVYRIDMMVRTSCAVISAMAATFTVQGLWRALHARP